MTDESTNAAAAMPPYAKREPKRREFHGDVFEDDYEWMRDKDSDDVRSYVAAENQYCERRMAHLADFRHTLFEELKSHVEETDMSVPTRVNDYWYFTRTQQGKQYGVQCRIPVRDADDWDPPVVDPQGAPGSMPGEQVVFDANKESEGHDFFRLGGLDLSKDGRWMLYGVDVAGDERYDFRIRDLAGLETGEPVSELPEQFTGIGSACFTPDGQWVFWVELDDSWRPLAVWRHRVGTAVESDVCVYRETDERFWVGVGISFDERNIVIGTGSKTTTEVLMLPVATPEGEFQAFIPRQNDIEYDVSFACFEGAGENGADVPFVDALTSILDPDLPLTVTEWDEWGDPLHDPEVYQYMKSYTPYENVPVAVLEGGNDEAAGDGSADGAATGAVAAAQFPRIFITTSMNDTRVLYVEPLKWLARLQSAGVDAVAKIEVEAGHGGLSGRYKQWEEVSYENAWCMDVMGLAH